MLRCGTIRFGVLPAALLWVVQLLAVLVLVLPLQRMEAAGADQADEGPLRFCLSASAMPRSGRAPSGSAQGVDVAVAKLIALHLDRPVELRWCGSDACRWQNLREQRCDVVIGVPHKSVQASDIAWTTPYASGKFGLLANRDGERVRSLNDLRGKRVGVVAGTVAVSEHDHSIVRFESREAMLRGFQQAKLDAGLIDADFAAWYLRDHPQLRLRLVDEFVSPQGWSIGLAVRASDERLREQVSRAVEVCLQRAQFPPVFAEYGLTHRAPLVEAKAADTTIAQDTWQRVRSGGKLTASMDPANLPYSSADPDRPGFDVELVRALGAEIGVDVEIHWIDVHRDTAMGELLDGDCDLAFGAAIDTHATEDEEALDDKVIYSRPYYGTGYVLVARQNSHRVKSLEELRGPVSRRVGTQAGTIADYSLRQRGYERRLYGTQLATLKALDDGDIDYAYLWSNIGWVLNTSPEFHAVLLSDYIPEERWNIAIAMRRGDVELKQHVDRAVGELLRKRLVQDALRRYHVPFLAPFDSQKPTLDGQQQQASRRQPLERGLEPQMERRQGSKHGYSGLEKIRSRGTLIVGLDQNNLPFSTAHPQPAGLDYEIARRIAEKMGVSLEVYWAYSSHDSYPAKLAQKGLCDVILGVMPDDRFADRVLFSEPYFHAEYQYAVRADQIAASDVNQLRDGLVAVEQGVAVRALPLNNVRRYGSLADVLEAVVTRQTPVGYVVSSRGHWLAEQRWPGEIRFISPPSTVDRFAICAAVARSEPDLKAAIDAALAELRQSGELQEVFARWNVPFDATRAIEKPTSGE